MGIMGRPVPVSAAPLAPVIEGEKCDRCGAAPRHRVYVPLGFNEFGTVRRYGVLLFCSHHMSAHESAIAARGYEVR
jgi:hypothetical protein